MACNEKEDYYFDDEAPYAPTNIRTYTGDNRVDITWNHSVSNDVAGYNVYFSFSYNGKYELIGSTEDNFFIDYEAENGNKYYYAVTAYDFNNNESELSSDVVYDIPRPEGFNQAVFDYLKFPDIAGYDFSEYRVTPFDTDNADFFFENYEGEFYINVWEDSDIQDMGATEDIYDITKVPEDGWVSLKEGENVKYAKAIPGHTYVIITWDNHAAKIRVNRITGERMFFDWAYQMVEGAEILKPLKKRSTNKIVKKIR